MRPRILVLLAAAAIAVFIALAGLIRIGLLGALDTAVMLAIHKVSTPALVYAALFLSTIGTVPSILVPIFATILWSLRRGDRAAALVVTVISLGTEGINLMLKLGFQRARPELWGRPELASFAFPSGHAMASVAIYGILAVATARAWPRSSTAMWVTAPLLALGIGLSRLVLGVHWPSDVMAGWAAGLVMLLSGIAGLRFAR